MTDGMKVEHDLCGERGGRLVGGKSRERRMHEPGMDDKPEGRERGREERVRAVGRADPLSYVVIPLRCGEPSLMAAWRVPT